MAPSSVKLTCTMTDRRKLMEVGEKIEHDFALPQPAQRDLPGNQVMAADRIHAEQFDEGGFGLVEVVDPD